MKKLIILLVNLFLIYSCDNDIDLVTPEVNKNNFIGQTTPIPQTSKILMEGIYEVLSGKELLGEQVVVKWTRDRLSIFSNINSGYIILESGHLDSVIFLVGYWRYASNTETGVANFYIPKSDGGQQIISGDSSFKSIRIFGEYGTGLELANKTIELKFKREFSQKVKGSNFQIMAHRGGGRNSEYLGVSENSIEMIDISERFGATGIEIDLRLSKDGVPFLYHDDDINLRLTQKSLIWGNIENFTWRQIRSLLTLSNGEKIPSLREALEFILEKTTLQVVWLDTKDVDVLDSSIELQSEFLERAKVIGRNLNIYIGIPAEDVYEKFIKLDNHNEIPSLCELSLDKVKQANSAVWAPRWTQGTLSADVNQVHNEGRLAFVWTLDEPSYIEEFISNGDFDGVLTNYPTLVSYYHYIK